MHPAKMLKWVKCADGVPVAPFACLLLTTTHRLERPAHMEPDIQVRLILGCVAHLQCPADYPQVDRPRYRLTHPLPADNQRDNGGYQSLQLGYLVRHGAIREMVCNNLR